jgi:hypothetical protein
MISKQNLGQRRGDVLSRTSALCCKVFFLVWVLGACQRSIAQELNSSTLMNGQRIDIAFEAFDFECIKKMQIELGKMFCGRIQFKTTDSLILKDLQMTRFNMTMPEHRHGLVTKPQWEAKKSGEYLIRGLKLHMPGDWQMDIEINAGKSTAQVAIPLKL